MRQRVKITGLGPVTPAGIGRAEFFAGINAPISRVQVVPLLSSRTGASVAAPVGDFRLEDWTTDAINLKRLPRQTQMAVAGLFLALEDAGIRIGDLAGTNPVIVNGSAFPDPELTQKTVAAVLTKGPRHAIPAAIVDAGPSAITGAMAKVLGTQCRTIAMQSACCAGMDAVGHGAEMIASGQAEIAFCCGTEAPIFSQPMIEFGMLKMSPRNARKPTEMGRPFDLWRNTGVIGEGCCVVILEAAHSPRPAYAWVEGYAYSNDEGGQPGNGLVASMQMALANAQHHVSAVDFINAWGPGHIVIDATEAQSLIKVFGDLLLDIPAVSIKGAIGNPLAAAGAIQVASTALSLQTGVIPPTVNWETPDPECPLNLSMVAREVGCTCALINAHGLSGTNATMILARK